MNKKVGIKIGGAIAVMDMSEYVRSVDNTLGEHEDVLDFISKMDMYQEDAEFSEELMKQQTNSFVKWCIEAEMHDEDIDWYMEQEEFLEAKLNELRKARGAK